ncbi:MAG: hydroxylamine reductase [Oligoflexia bacterium]|nr:hydroxylamine reductase [Oligoflexia bacterium]MBF0365805.1 hydroxylamine reductase [Oligoflexia bacterium]
MSMFCYQCQEAMKGEACNAKKGMCGKTDNVANLQDLLLFVVRGISLYAEKGLNERSDLHPEVGPFVTEALFATITNANFDQARFVSLIRSALKLRNLLKEHYGPSIPGNDHESLRWYADNENDFLTKAQSVGVLTTENIDIRSLRELLVYGIKGIAAYTHHAMVLNYTDNEIFKFMIKGMAATTKDLSADELVGLVMEAGKTAVTTMALLDKANTTTYGNPEITKVNIGVKNRPGILVSGHDLKDFEELLEQSKDAGIDIYTHSEMLPAHYYPKFKKYSHFVGNYGNAWWKQDEEFASFNGPILMTTNCIVPVKDSYKDRIFTTGVVGYTGIKHISNRNSQGQKDFSAIIEMAKHCPAPKEIETGEIIGGFAHNQVLALADKVVAAIKGGAVKKFVVMAGCDARQNSRNYFTDVAKGLTNDTIILTAGCAKYRYNKLNLGDIGGIPRVLDAGQCNDSYSLAVVALKLKEVFGLADINELPIEYDIAWYEQKAVAVLLALLFLGVKNIRLGPTLPAFLSPNVAKVLVEKFNIRPIKSAEEDLQEICGVR